jgi:hypothetical protein
MAELFDFGFTAVTEDELEVVQTAKEQAEGHLDTHDRLVKLYNAVQPLLNNLKANPEKDYIYWPNRLDKVEEFSDLLDNLYKGEL